MQIIQKIQQISNGNHEEIEENIAIKSDTQMNSQTLHEMKFQIETLQKAKQSLYKKRLVQSDQFTAKINQLQFENQLLAQNFKDKEKECNIASSKLNELRRIVKHNALIPLDLTPGTPNLLAQKQHFLSPLPLHQPKSIIEIKGLKLANEEYLITNMTEFDEYQKEVKMNHRIIKIKIYWHKEFAVGLQVDYMLKNGTVLNGIDCISDEMKNKADAYELILNASDSINVLNAYAG